MLPPQPHEWGQNSLKPLLRQGRGGQRSPVCGVREHSQNQLSVLTEPQHELIVANTNDGLASARAAAELAGAGRSSPRARPPLAQRL